MCTWLTWPPCRKQTCLGSFHLKGGACRRQFVLESDCLLSISPWQREPAECDLVSPSAAPSLPPSALSLSVSAKKCWGLLAQTCKNTLKAQHSHFLNSYHHLKITYKLPWESFGYSLLLSVFCRLKYWNSYVSSKDLQNLTEEKYTKSYNTLKTYNNI